tara:strand:+ start:70 stop:609 length:540 start_codon:yes stop_codon:yes gene_type:complete
MSCTELYLVTKDKNCNCEEFKNAFRGAMYVWNDIARRYAGYDHFPHFECDEQMEVWNYYTRHPGVMKPHDMIVLASTMDYAIVEAHRWKDLVEAFKQYGEEHPNSNYSDQAEAIEGLVELIGIENLSYIAWNQTSVNSFWGVDYVEETDEFEYYDPDCSQKHFWVFKHLEDTVSETSDE